MLVIQYWDVKAALQNHNIRALTVVLSYAVIQWAAARAFLWARQRSNSGAWYACALAVGLFPLLFAKVFASIHSNSPATEILGFVGISYVTFRCLDVIIGIRDRLITELPLIKYAGYLLLFSTISSGPVDRYRRFSNDWDATRTREQFLDDLDGAVERIFRGFLYKFLLATLIYRNWLAPLRHSHSVLGTVSYMYGYSFYLFFDFAGYTAFAVALSYLVGIHTPENFNWPFISRNIREFWDRWHISLSWWFRDHIYMRFVMASMKGKWFVNRYTGSHIGFLLTMTLMGLWHGLELHYLVYGIYHGALLVINDIFSRWNKERGLLKGQWGRAVAVFLTFNAVCFGLLIFSGRLF